MHLYFIRHGQSTNNALTDPSQRVVDPALTALGQQQSEQIARYLATGSDLFPDGSDGFAITHLYTSPMLRTLQTAQPIAEALGLQPQVWVDIHEIGGMFLEVDGDFVGYPGMIRQEVEALFPDYGLPDNLSDKGWWNPDDGMEVETAAQYRALKVVDALRRRALNNERIALVSHGGFIDRALKALLNQLPNIPRTVFYAHYNTAITRIDCYHQDSLRLHYLNRVEHLTPDLRSW
ncbi:MAG TPA: histidine phosphatase family protein [Candidatus Tectomicrobia bacterium]|jgi:2,3-bisphosphoglycerate-dependent phosphoglycerate mutase